MEFTKKKYTGLGNVPIGIGAVLKGWDIPENRFGDPEKLPVVDFRAMTHNCPWDCFHCFTDKNRKTLTLKEIKNVIDQLAETGTRAIDYLGEGEPTIDDDFFEIVEYTAKKGIIPIVFTDAATKLRDREFVRRLYRSGASVCPKCDSLWNAEYQNWVVGDKTGRYFDKRNEAVKILMEEGFSEVQKDGTTRLGFDMVVSSKNHTEIEKTLRYCRDNNIFVIFSFFLPTGRSGMETFDKSLMLSNEEKRKIQGIVKKVDMEYGFEHAILNNFMTFQCVEFMCIYGDGRVSPCVGNEAIIGNVRKSSIKELSKKIVFKFPGHDRKTFDGHCLYRPRIY
jgi:MoaA/NifB/PqqE/SkfB family radical SAM enzyme